MLGEHFIDFIQSPFPNPVANTSLATKQNTPEPPKKLWDMGTSTNYVKDNLASVSAAPVLKFHIVESEISMCMLTIEQVHVLSAL